jgi:hypothetical protein
MAEKNLWGQLPSADEVRSPGQILKEQASMLTKLTNGVLEGAVRMHQLRGDFILTFKIIAPALDNYEYSVLHVGHKVELYPLRVQPSWDVNGLEAVECENEDEFEEALTQIFGDARVRGVITSLIAQSRTVE